MAGNIINYSAGTERVIQIAAQVDALSDDFNNEYTQMYSMIEGELSSAWKGEDSVAFKEKVGEMKHFFDTMRETMNEYATFLRNTANAHEARMDDSRTLIDANCDF
jgi:WXG100 family type VII secretion target